MKILILGAGGMLGHKLYQTLDNDFNDVWASFRKNQKHYANFNIFNPNKIIDKLDVTKKDRLLEVLQQLQPDVICNCIGITTRKMNQQSLEKLIELNSRLPHVLSEWCQLNNSKLIHISTDCVFSGKESGNYTEESLTDAEDIYGRSKALGEVSGPNCLTLRSSIVGRELENKTELIEWVMSQAGKNISGYTHAIYSGVTTNFLAKTISQVIKNHSKLEGIYQIASPQISKYDLISKLNSQFQLGINLTPDNEVSSNKSLVGEKFSQATGIKTPSWDQLIKELYDDKTEYMSKGRAA